MNKVLKLVRSWAPQQLTVCLLELDAGANPSVEGFSPSACMLRAVGPGLGRDSSAVCDSRSPGPGSPLF